MFRIPSKARLLPLLGLLLVLPAGHGAVVPGLYTAQVPAAGLSGPALDQAFALALDQVLVKVTGQRDIATDPARRRAIGPAPPLVRQYQPVAGGQVRVSFDAASLRRRLDAAGLPVWADDRPLTRVLIADAGPAAGTGPAPVRQDFEAAAAARGVPVAVSVVAAGTAEPSPGDGLLTGTPVPTAGRAQFRWTLDRDAARTSWQGDAAAGADGLADRLAARYAAVASDGQVLRLRIRAVDDFDAYGRLQAYLRTVGLIRSADLRGVRGGEFIYDVTVRGTPAQLDDAFALRGLLVPVDADEAAAGQAGARGGERIYRLDPGVVPVREGP